MLVELGLVEQRYKAVLEVMEGADVIDVARRYGVVRQTVHTRLRNYATRGLAGLVDGSSRPLSCPHRTAPEVEARIVELRHEHPGWGPRTIGHRLGREGVEPVPGRSSVHRCLVRHGLITPHPRRRRRSDYKRRERSRAMELWQMDVVGGLRPADGTEGKVSPGSTTTAASASRRSWWPAPPPGPPATRCPWPCVATAFPGRSSPTTARSSPVGSGPAPARCSSTASAGRTA